VVVVLDTHSYCDGGGGVFWGSGDGDNITADKGDVLLATLAIFYLYICDSILKELALVLHFV
jgi:hypothetical protein